jgi:hypothetical protein
MVGGCAKCGVARAPRAAKEAWARWLVVTPYVMGAAIARVAVTNWAGTTGVSRDQ